jgi:uncharacterized protein (TIGR01319 family)
MSLTLAIDFGSTYTKVVAVDLAREEVVAVVQARSTVQTDVMMGLEEALKKLEDITGTVKGNIDRMVSCSSAAGGLRMVVAGLVRELTTKAAQEACLGAGAKLVAAYSNGLVLEDINQIEQIWPDIILLTGGTDGGNEEVILNNARLVAESRLDSPVVIAGNRRAAARAKSSMEAGGKYAVIAENVLPEIDRLNVEPTRAVIRDIFMARIVKAKGLDRAKEIIGDIIMPTPMAILNAATLLAEGAEGTEGLGELVVVDVGGATTDIHSVAQGAPSLPGTMVKGLPEPYRKRTVEGDLGIRYNARSILELVGEQRIKELLPNPYGESLHYLNLPEVTELLSRCTGKVPVDDRDHQVDVGLATAAVDVAMKRHAGTIEEIYLPSGKVLVQRGKDLKDIKCIIGTGGIFAYGRLPGWILSAACYDEARPESLRPVQPEMFIDDRYIMFAIGLLAEKYPGKALRIMKKSLKKVENGNQERRRG